MESVPDSHIFSSPNVHQRTLSIKRTRPNDSLYLRSSLTEDNTVWSNKCESSTNIILPEDNIRLEERIETIPPAHLFNRPIIMNSKFHTLKMPTQPSFATRDSSSSETNNETPDKQENSHTYIHMDTMLLPEKMDIEKKKKLISTIGYLLLKFGCPCQHVERSLQQTAIMLGIECSFSLTPDLLLISPTLSPTDNSGTSECISLIFKAAVSYDMGKLSQISAAMSVFRLENNIDHCLSSLNAINDAPPTVGSIQACCAFCVLAFTASVVMFEGSWIDATLGGALGLLVGLLALLADHAPAYARVFEVSSCLLVGLIAQALNKYACFMGSAVPAILVLLPGYGMTMAVMELSSRQITAGTIRLVYAAVYTFMLGYGLHTGSSLYTVLEGSSGSPPYSSAAGHCFSAAEPAVAISPFFYILLLPLMAISIGISFKSAPKQWLSQVGCATTGFCVIYFLGKIVPDPNVTNTIAAFAAGLYANFALKLVQLPPVVPLCVGITLLVPGSLGVKGVYELLNVGDLAQGMFALQMLRSALGISVGLLAAAMVVYPADKRRSLYISL